MKIGVDIRSMLSLTGRGVSHYASSLLTELVHRYPQDEWYLLQTGRRPFQLPDALQKPNVTLHRLSLPNKVLNTSLGLLGRPRLDRHLPPVDVFFAPNLGFVRLSPRIPLVLTVHDLSFKVRPEWFTPAERTWHRMVRPGALARRASKVIAISDQTKHELEHFLQLDPASIRVIHSGIDDLYRTPPNEDMRRQVREQFGLAGPYVLFMGAAEPRKNLPTLLAGYVQAREQGLAAELVIAGSPSRHLDDLLRGISGPVRTLGYVPEEVKPALYAEAQTLALISFHEGFGFPPLEALACGTPSLVSDYPVSKEILGDAAARVDVRDAAGVAWNLVQLENDQAYRQTLLNRGQAIVERMTWTRTAEETYAVLAAAAAGSEHRRLPGDSRESPSTLTPKPGDSRA